MNLWTLNMGIKNYFKYRTIFSKLWLEYHLPLYQWYKAKDKFKKPICHFSFGKPHWFFGWYVNPKYINPIIDIRSSSLGWKDKENSPRHEWDPFFAITFFRRYRFIWIWNYISDPLDTNDCVRSMSTWEALLDYLYYDRDIRQVSKYHVWEDSKGNRITIDKNLTNSFTE